MLGANLLFNCKIDEIKVQIKYLHGKFSIWIEMCCKCKIRTRFWRLTTAKLKYLIKILITCGNYNVLDLLDLKNVIKINVTGFFYSFLVWLLESLKCRVSQILLGYVLKIVSAACRWDNDQAEGPKLVLPTHGSCQVDINSDECWVQGMGEGCGERRETLKGGEQSTASTRMPSLPHPHWERSKSKAPAFQ